MELQLSSGLLLSVLSVHLFLTAKSLELHSVSVHPCFVSCVCNMPDSMQCIGDAHFRHRVEELNHFLRNSSASLKMQVHIHTESTSLPSFLPKLPLVHNLSLSENSISLVQNGVLYGMRLVQLNISRNELQTIQTDAFGNLAYLRVLDLSHNRLISLSKQVFSDMPYLEMLNLEWNHLAFFPFYPFSLVPHLQVLQLTNNHLTHLPPGSLVSLPSLRYFLLGNNSLQILTVDLLRELPSLEILELSHNPFHCSCTTGRLGKVFNTSTRLEIVDSSHMTCFTPLGLRGKALVDVESELEKCSKPKSVLSYDSSNILYANDMELRCDVQGDPDPAVLWVTPWGDKFADSTQLPHLQQVCGECQSLRIYSSPAVDFKSEVSVQGGGKMLRITKFRGFFMGNFTCYAFNYLGNDSVLHRVKVYSAMHACLIDSIVFGSFCAAGFLCFGLSVGSIKIVVLACRTQFSRQRKVTCTRTATVDENTVLTSAAHCHDVSMDFTDDFYPPETPFTTPIASSPPTSPGKVQTPTSPAEGEGTPPFGSWRSSNILETMEEVRWRLRHGVGRRMKSVRRNVQSVKETGRRNVQSIKESSSVYMQSIKETGTTAASKVKASVVLGMETVKWHVQSIREFCGTGDMGTHTVSAVSMETDVDTNETKEVVKSVTMV